MTVKDFVNQRRNRNKQIQIEGFTKDSRYLKCKDLGTDESKIFNLANLINCMKRGKVKFNRDPLNNSKQEFTEHMQFIKEKIEKSIDVTFDISTQESVFVNEEGIHMIKYRTIEDLK